MDAFKASYLTHKSKIATIEPEAKTKSFLIRDQEGKTVWRTKHATTKKSPFSSKIRQEIDFSSITKPGRYTLVAGRHQQSFIISSDPYTETWLTLMGFFSEEAGIVNAVSSAIVVKITFFIFPCF